MLGGFEGEPEKVLEKTLAGLEPASVELGAAVLAVLVAEDSFVEMVYPPAPPIMLTAELQQVLTGRSGAISAEHPLAAFLASHLAPGARSFLLFVWSVKRRVVVIVFGFAECRPPYSLVPVHAAEGLKLAALAAWSAKEIARLRAELRAVNSQFAGRKLVERAKGILQTQHGMSEQEAYELLRKMSRQRRVAMAKLAEDLVGAARCP